MYFVLSCRVNLFLVESTVTKKKIQIPLCLRYIKDWVCKYLIQKVMGVVYLRKETCYKYETWPWSLSC